MIRSTHVGSLVRPDDLIAYMRRVHPTIQWAKLEALSEGAAPASQRLAGAPA